MGTAMTWKMTSTASRICTAGRGLRACWLFWGFLVIIVCALIRNARRYFTVEAGACGVALCTALAHIYNTAGVLRRPNASFYLCLILASIWYLIYIRDYDDSKEN